VPDHAAVPLRRATAQDLRAIAVADGRAFGMHHSDADLDDFRPLFDPDRFLLAGDPAAGEIVGVTGSFPFDVTLPGGASLPAPGVSWVSVAATHRRRGILRALLERQHRDFAADGVAVSLLTASEGGIYGRFGYGTATVQRSVEISRRLAALRPGTPDPGGVRQVEGDDARALAPAIHRRWAAVTPGAVSRADAWWDDLLRDREHRRRGGSALFHLVHPDGYAAYRMVHDDRSCGVVDLFAVTEQAHAALWRVLLGLDLVETITVRSHPLDDPLQLLLTDPRQVRTTGLADGMWARVLDVAAVLSARRYAVELDVVLDVHDPFLQLGGRFRLRAGPAGASCERAGAGAAGAAVDIGALGSLLFGGRRAVSLARAGLLECGDAATLRRIDAAFLVDRAPEHDTAF
jgi:predicted acetyltransferase